MKEQKYGIVLTASPDAQFKETTPRTPLKKQKAERGKVGNENLQLRPDSERIPHCAMNLYPISSHILRLPADEPALVLARPRKHTGHPRHLLSECSLVNSPLRSTAFPL